MFYWKIVFIFATKFLKLIIMDITKLVRSRNLSKAELSEKLGILPQNLSKLLANPTERTAKRLAKALGCEVWELYVSSPEDIYKQLGVTVHECPHCKKSINVRFKTKIELSPMKEDEEEERRNGWF